jgi:hypothetical protein
MRVVRPLPVIHSALKEESEVNFRGEVFSMRTPAGARDNVRCGAPAATGGLAADGGAATRSTSVAIGSMNRTT